MQHCVPPTFMLCDIVVFLDVDISVSTDFHHENCDHPVFELKYMYLLSTICYLFTEFFNLRARVAQ